MSESWSHLPGQGIWEPHTYGDWPVGLSFDASARAVRQWVRSSGQDFTGAAVLPDGHTVAVRSHQSSPAAYWATTPEGLVLSDNISVVVNALAPAKLCTQFFVQTLTGTGGETDLTPYEGVFRLPPGVMARWSLPSQRPITHSLWEIPALDRSLASAPLIDLGEELWERILRSTSLKDAQACEMSGGLDSSAVVAAYVTRAGQSVTAFSWKPVEVRLSEYSEAPYVRALADSTGVDPVYVDTHINAEGTPGLSHVQPHPIGAHAGLRLEALELARSRGFRSLLSGHGGDQAASFRSAGQLADAIRHPSVSRTRSALATVRSTPRARRRSLVRSSLTGPRSQERRDRAATDELLSLMFPDARDYLGSQAPHYGSSGDLEIDRRRGIESGVISRRIEIDQWLGLHFGLSYDYPLLDRQVFDWCLTVPAHRWFEAGVDRAVMRAALEGHVPDMIRLRTHKQAPAPRGSAELAWTREPALDQSMVRHLLPGLNDRTYRQLHPRAQSLIRLASDFIELGGFDRWDR